jgi:hypothetical protein
MKPVTGGFESLQERLYRGDSENLRAIICDILRVYLQKPGPHDVFRDNPPINVEIEIGEVGCSSIGHLGLGLKARCYVGHRHILVKA